MKIKDLSIKRELSEETRAQGIAHENEVYSLHIKGDEVIITDYFDYTKIYAIYSLDFWNT